MLVYIFTYFVVYKNLISRRELFSDCLEDYQNGHFAGYSNPRLATGFQERLLSYDIEPIVDIAMKEGYADVFSRRLNELYDAIRTGKCVPYRFRLGDNWTAREQFDVITLLYRPRPSEQPSQIMLTQRTRTEHLTPFIDGKVEDGMLTVYGKGKDVLREKL